MKYLERWVGSTERGSFLPTLNILPSHINEIPHPISILPSVLHRIAKWDRGSEKGHSTLFHIPCAPQICCYALEISQSGVTEV